MKSFMMRCVFLSYVGISISACSTTLRAKQDDPAFSPSYPTSLTTSPNTTGSIYQSNPRINLYQDRRAHAVGDILTVTLTENTQAKKQANTNTERKTSTDIPNPTILSGAINGGHFPGLGFTTANDTKLQGTANSNQSNNLVGTITVSVYRVLPNGYLMVRGEKWITLNQGDEYIRLSGIVRPDDIDSNNQVDSTRIGDARITYSGTGELAESNGAGWLTRFFSGGMNGLFPF